MAFSTEIEPLLVEVGDDLLDLDAGVADAFAAAGDERTRTGDPLGEPVDIDVVTLEFVQDSLELLECLGVPEFGGRLLLLAHADSLIVAFLGSAALMGWCPEPCCEWCRR